MAWLILKLIPEPTSSLLKLGAETLQPPELSENSPATQTELEHFHKCWNDPAIAYRGITTDLPFGKCGGNFTCLSAGGQCKFRELSKASSILFEKNGARCRFRTYDPYRVKVM